MQYEGEGIYMLCPRLQCRHGGRASPASELPMGLAKAFLKAPSQCHFSLCPTLLPSSFSMGWWFKSLLHKPYAYTVSFLGMRTEGNTHCLQVTQWTGRWQQWDEPWEAEKVVNFRLREIGSVAVVDSKMRFNGRAATCLRSQRQHCWTPMIRCPRLEQCKWRSQHWGKVTTNN